MSSMCIASALARIRSAPSESPIAVFRSIHPGRINCVFAKTVRTQAFIRHHDPDFIGVFHTGHNPESVRVALHPFVWSE